MKNIFLGICLLGIYLSFTFESGKLSGVATFRDAYMLSDQADAGCEIYAIHEADLRSTKYDDIKSVVEVFQGYKYDYLLSIYNSIDAARNKKLQDNFDTISNSTAKFLAGFRNLPGVIKTGTNGTGNYTLNVKPGKYYLLYISGSVKSKNIAESKGNFGYKIVEVKSTRETFQNVCFQKYEMIGIMPARNLSGC
jgi:1,2-phenylacetyl-CoA epoxidase PaaB subunit